MTQALPPPPKKADERFDNWVFTLWKRAIAALVSGGVGATSPITITTSGTGTVNIGHGTSGVATGTYGSLSQIPIVAVDTYGHITLATSSALTGTGISGVDLTISSPLIGTATNALLRAGTIGHSTSGVTAGSYSNYLPITVDAYGHVTAVGTPHFYLTTRTIPAATDGFVEIGTANFSNGAGNLWLSVAAEAVGYSVAKEFLVPCRYNGEPSYAQVAPLADSGVYSDGYNFSLAGQMVNDVLSLRLWNSGSGTAITPNARVTIRHEGSPPDTFTLSTGTGTWTPPSTYWGAAGLTQANGTLSFNGSLVHSGVSGVVTGTYGGALGLPSITVDTYGHISAGTSFPLQATVPILLGSNAGTYTWGHSTSGIASGTYGGSGVSLQVVVNTFGHVTAASTFAAASGKWTPWAYIVTATDTLDIDDGKQMLFAEQLIVEGTGVINIDGTGQLHIL